MAKKREAKERNKSRQKLHELMMRQEEGGRRRREEKEVLEMLVLRMVMVMVEMMRRQRNSMPLNLMISTRLQMILTSRMSLKSILGIITTSRTILTKLLT